MSTNNKNGTCFPHIKLLYRRRQERELTIVRRMMSIVQSRANVFVFLPIQMSSLEYRRLRIGRRWVRSGEIIYGDLKLCFDDITLAPGVSEVAFQAIL